LAVTTGLPCKEGLMPDDWGKKASPSCEDNVGQE
jgi:hypothetical protein